MAKDEETTTTQEPKSPPVSPVELVWKGPSRPDGTPVRFFTGVPTRNLTKAEVNNLPKGLTAKRLVDSGLYEEKK